MGRTGSTEVARRTQHLVLAGLLACCGCTVDPPLPPDPDRPVPEVDCSDTGAPLSLSSTQADSSLESPPWIEVCTLCPSTSIELRPGGLESDLPLASAWASDRACAVAVAEEPLPDREHLEVEATIHAGERSGETEFEVDLPAGRGSNPVDLGTSTWTLAFEPEDLRHPQLASYEPFTPEPWPAVLLHLGEPLPDGRREVTVGLTEPGSQQQDLCVPTQTWQSPVTLDRRQLGGALEAGDVLPTPVGGPLRRGAWQARMSSSGSALSSIAFLALLDLNQLEQEIGMSPDALCESLEETSDVSPCVPCGEPSEGIDGLPTCITMLWELPLAAAAPDALVPVSTDSLPPEC